MLIWHTSALPLKRHLPSPLLLILHPFFSQQVCLYTELNKKWNWSKKNHPNHFPILTGHVTNRCFLWPRQKDEVDKVHTGTRVTAQELLWPSELHWVFPALKGRKYHIALPLFPTEHRHFCRSQLRPQDTTSVLTSSSSLVFLLRRCKWGSCVPIHHYTWTKS